MCIRLFESHVYNTKSKEVIKFRTLLWDCSSTRGSLVMFLYILSLRAVHYLSQCHVAAVDGGEEDHARCEASTQLSNPTTHVANRDPIPHNAIRARL
jgi:hypothetical protein